MSHNGKYGCVEDFVVHQLQLLDVERQAEVAENRQLHENVSSKLLQSRGVCLVNLSLVNVRSGLYGRSVASFAPKLAASDLPATSLGSGLLSSLSVSPEEQ